VALTSTVAFSSAFTSVMAKQTDATSVSDTDITGGSNLVVTTIEVDALTNSLPGGETAYLKLYDNGSPTVGTTGPTMVLPTIGGVRHIFQISGGGYTFGTAVSMACVTNGGGDAGTTSPTVDVIVIVTSE
jgi:hypothetical protein